MVGAGEARKVASATDAKSVAVDSAAKVVTVEGCVQTAVGIRSNPSPNLASRLMVQEGEEATRSESGGDVEAAHASIGDSQSSLAPLSA